MAADIQDTSEVPATGGSGGVSVLLREARRQRGQDIAAVASALRIRQPYLQAIEEGRFLSLPGPTYAVGFLRAYAEYLGLDSNEIVRRFRQENGDFASPAELSFPSAVSEGGLPKGALLTLAIIAAVAAYGVWYWFQSREGSYAEKVPSLPDRLAALIKKPTGSGSETPPAEPAKPGETPLAPVPAAPPPATSFAPPGPPPAVQPPQAPPVPPAPQPPPVFQPPQAPPGTAREEVIPPADDNSGSAAGESAVAPPPAEATKPPPAQKAGEAKGKSPKAAKAPPPEPPGETAQATPVPPAPSLSAQPPPEPPPALPGAIPSADAGQIILHANEDCWIEIRDPSGQIVHSRVLRRGDNLPVPGDSGLKLTAGNAGALVIMVDGRSIGSLGRIGMVRRDVPLDIERLRARRPSE